MKRGHTTLEERSRAGVTEIASRFDDVRSWCKSEQLAVSNVHFGSTWDTKAPIDEAFPIRKEISKEQGGFRLQLVGLDSTNPQPVWVVGFNAHGRIDTQQLDRLAAILQERRTGDLCLVVLHHHPIVVPDLLPETQDHFLRLNKVDGKRLIRLCVHTGVSAIQTIHVDHWVDYRDSHRPGVWRTFPRVAGSDARAAGGKPRSDLHSVFTVGPAEYGRPSTPGMFIPRP